MKITNLCNTFTTPRGGVALVNAVPDAWCIIDPSCRALERSIDHLHKAVPVAQRNRFACADWWNQVRNVPRTGTFDDAAAWLETSISTVALTSRPTNAYQAVALLSYLRLNGALLWPAAQTDLPHPYPLAVGIQTISRTRSDGSSISFSRSPRMVCDAAITACEDALLEGMGKGARIVARSLLTSISCINDYHDLSEDALINLIEAASTWGWRKETRSKTRSSSDLLTLYRKLEGIALSHGNQLRVVARAEQILKNAGRRGKQSQEWGKHGDNPSLAPWRDAFENYLAITPRRNKQHMSGPLITWLDFLSPIANPPLPQNVERELHIIGPTGFQHYIKKRFEVGSTRPQFNLSGMRAFFDWQADNNPGFVSPIRLSDVPPSAKSRNKSAKPRTPRDVVDHARQVCRELIYQAYIQAQSFGLGPAHSFAGLNSDVETQKSIDHDLPSTLVKPDLFERCLITAYHLDGSRRRIINPTLPTLLLMMLIVPLRGIQARLLDSGEGDEYIPIIRTESPQPHEPLGKQTISVEWVKNTHKLATAGRAEGVLRRIIDTNIEREFVGLWINTNKTSAAALSPGRDVGYEIPWQQVEIVTCLYNLRIWQSRFNAVQRFLSRDDLQEKVLHPTNALKGLMPAYTYLFREMKDQSLSTADQPPTAQVLAQFFFRVLDEVEGRLVREAEANNKKVNPRLVIARKGKIPSACAYSLHSLRVTGITAFAEAGVPANVIAEFLAGHLTVLMSVYYTKFGPDFITRILNEAEYFQENELQNSINSLQSKSLGELEGLLAFEERSALQSLKDQVPGFWKASIDGICPNGMTRCDDGGPALEGSGNNIRPPVRGGARNCPLCRFWLTGPAFIAGQVILANAALYHIRNLGTSIVELHRERRRPDKQHLRSYLSDKIDKLEAEIDLSLISLNARFRLLEKSIALANIAKDADTSENSANNEERIYLLTRMNDGDLELHLTQTTDLSFRDFLCQAVVLFPEINVHEAAFERNMILDQILDRDGFDGMLFRVPRSIQTRAGNAFTNYLRRAYGNNAVDDVASGTRKIFEYDIAAIEEELAEFIGNSSKPLEVFDMSKLLKATR